MAFALELVAAEDEADGAGPADDSELTADEMARDGPDTELELELEAAAMSFLASRCWSSARAVANMSSFFFFTVHKKNSTTKACEIPSEE